MILKFLSSLGNDLHIMLEEDWRPFAFFEQSHDEILKSSVHSHSLAFVEWRASVVTTELMLNDLQCKTFLSVIWKTLLSLVADTSTPVLLSFLQTLVKMVLLFYKLAKIQRLETPKYLPALSLSYHRTGFAEVLAVLPPFPITLPAAKDGTLIWASSFTSSLGLTKFSSLIFP